MQVGTLTLCLPKLGDQEPCLHCAVISLTNVNINIPLTQLYMLCKVPRAGKACPIILRFDKFRYAPTMSTLRLLATLNAIFCVIAYPRFPVAVFEALFD